MYPGISEYILCIQVRPDNMYIYAHGYPQSIYYLLQSIYYLLVYLQSIPGMYCQSTYYVRRYPKSTYNVPGYPRMKHIVSGYPRVYATYPGTPKINILYPATLRPHKMYPGTSNKIICTRLPQSTYHVPGYSNNVYCSI